MHRAERVVLGDVHEAPMPTVRPEDLRQALSLCECRGVARSGDLSVKVSVRALQAMEKASIAVSPLTCAGALLGTVYQVGDTWLVDVQEALAVNATPEMHRVRVPRHAWQEMLRVRKAQFADMRVVGWYHSHPGLGAGFSDADSFVQKFFFPADWQVACVVDPERRDMQFFSRRGRNVGPLSAYWVEKPGAESGHTTAIPSASASVAVSAPPPPLPSPPRPIVEPRRDAEPVREPMREPVREPVRDPGRSMPVPQRNGGRPMPLQQPPETLDSQASSETYLKERFVERSLEKIMRMMKEPPLTMRDFIMFGMLGLLLIALFLTRGSSGGNARELADIAEKLDRISQRLDAGTLPAPAKPTPANSTSPAASPSLSAARSTSPNEAKKAPAQGEPDVEHTIVPDETLWNVAEQYYGDGSQMGALMRYNKVQDARVLKPGFKVMIPSAKKLAVLAPARVGEKKPSDKKPAAKESPAGAPPTPTPH